MKFLHTGDWHIGKPLRTQRRDAEHEAVLAEILDIAGSERVDALLVAGDVFETSSPSADSERLVYEFFTELAGTGIPAVLVGGNHDHPKRLEAISPLLKLAGVHVRGDAVSPESGGVLSLPSRDGREIATIGLLPWVPESRVVDFEKILAAAGHPYQQYADAIAGLIRILGRAFTPNGVNILLGHLFVSGAFVGQEGGERPIHLGQTYAVTPEAIPAAAQYVALGHVHRGQRVPAPAPAYYSGSPLQLDFGEAGQDKGVNIFEARAGLPAEVRFVPLSAGRRLRDVEGTLEELRLLAPEVGDDYLRVRVRLEGPVLELADRVRELLPNAVDIRPIRPPAPEDEATESRLSLGPEELVTEFYQREHGREMPEDVVTLFRRLYEEERRETTPA